MPPGDWTSYFWPGTTVLRNKLGIHDPDELHTEEYLYASARQIDLELRVVIIPATYDADHLRNVHRHLFQDVYDWAGEHRTVSLAKNTSEFAPTNRIASYLDAAASIADDMSWQSMTADQFAKAMAKVYAWVNHAHPFREGNGRAAKYWLSEIAEQSPWQLDFEQVEADIWNQAAASSGPGPGYTTLEFGTLIPVFAAMTHARLADLAP